VNERTVSIPARVYDGTMARLKQLEDRAERAECRLLGAVEALASKDEEIGQLKAKIEGLIHAGNLIADDLAAYLAKG